MLKLNIEKLRCGRCRKSKFEIEFSRNKQRASGRASWCKSCYQTYKLSRRDPSAEVYETYYATRADA